ncbi:selenocysteine insertion sequence-binding protein 2-like [Sinocyclocheilus anshuiensis]|uniref:selenocysteine insertion sequence-binding protein 2-like n=1 Tax=Sinocyclocheilus anshuiensis TaxID=1608454 RepID=UPI0007B95FA1|nr:PREDICTED: selenocysteine insertion sequence-binding protein 2-like [Sinocyclocheilus anshuiensis]
MCVFQDVKLSAEVEPFIPQKKGVEASLLPMSLCGEGVAEPTQIPSYLITCYPFVQENQNNSRQMPVYNGDHRWQQLNPSPGGPYLAYPFLSSPQPPVTSDYPTYYHTIMPTPCPPVMGFYQPFPGPLQAGVLNPVSDCSERPLPQSQTQRGRGISRNPVPHKQPVRAKRLVMRSVAVQKEVCAAGPDGRSKTVLLVDAAQQTDFPGEASGSVRCALDQASPQQWKKAQRRRTSQQESSSEQGASEADIDSDSGYCSPKHNQGAANTSTNQPTAAAVRSARLALDTCLFDFIMWKKAQRRRTSQQESSSEQGASEADIDSDSGYCSPKHNQGAANTSTNQPTAAAAVDAGVMTGAAVSWGNVASQTVQKPWTDRNTAYHRGRTPEQRNYTQDFQMSFGGRAGAQRSTPSETPNTHLTPEPLYFQDEDEFPDLATGGSAQRNKPEPVQPKLPKNLLDNLPENSPISIVQTPIPITSSVPKRAKSQRKKALAAALATAQEYNEISMEQKKLQEALTKAAGKKSRTPVQLDLGDMLAALEKQQQAMRARQLNNTKPLSYTVGTVGTLHSKDRVMGLKNTYTPPHNILDSSAPRVKRGKEREIPKVKKTTAMKKIILQEREVKKGKSSAENSVSGTDEQKEALSFTDPLTQEQDENGLSMPSDASLSPASQNSPYSITPVSQGSPSSSGIGSPMAASAITKIHSRRFREYCNQVLSKEIDESVTLLLQELVRFQEQVYQKEPSKAKAKRRLVMGLREVTKHMKLHKIKCVIISPNCEKIQAKGGLDEALYNVIAMAREQEIPFVFALGRKALGRCVNKLVPVSVCQMHDYRCVCLCVCVQALFNKLVSLTEEARRAYKDMVSALEQEQAEEALKNVKKVTHHMGHSRNPSAASAISFCSVISEPISEVNEKEYETNWRTMVESADAPEPLETKPVSRASSKEQPTASPDPSPAAARARAPEKDESHTDDRLERASQQSTDTGSLDGSCRDRLNSSITSTTSTLVPGMLEEEEEEEEEEEDYTPEPISVQVPPLSSRIESWVSKTLENLQLRSQSSTEDEDEEEEELDSSDLAEPAVDDKDAADSSTG